MKVKRKLTKISFDFDKAHLAYTSGDYPACSLLDDPILLKSLETGKKLTLEQQEILEAAGHDISEVAKSMEEKTKASTSEGKEVDNFKTTEKDDDMSEALQKELQELRKELAISKIEKQLAKYSFSEELEKELASALADCTDAEVVYKALDAIVDAGKEEVEKVSQELEKAKEAKEESPLEKALQDEAGIGGEAEETTIEKSRAEKINDLLKAEIEK